MKRIAGLVIGVAVFGLMVAPASAALKVKLSGHTSVFENVGGGSFGATRQGNLAEWNAAGIKADFRTFCVEDVVFNPGTTYFVKIDTKVKNGAVGDAALTEITKRAYAHYRAGNLFQTNDAAYVSKNKALQALFWEQEGVKIGSNAKAPFSLLNASEKNYYNSFLAFATNTPIAAAANVRVMNMWKNADYTGDAQSQLCQIVPAPGAVLLGVLGSAVLAAWRRRQSA